MRSLNQKSNFKPPFFKTWCKTVQAVPSSFKGGRTHSLVLDEPVLFHISAPLP